MHEWGERVRGLSRLKVSEVRGEGGTLLTQCQGQRCATPLPSAR